MTCVPALVLLLSSLGGMAAPTGPKPCLTISVSVDTSQVDSFETVYLGRGWGQVFAADDTILRAVTVWRPAFEPVVYSTGQLFITVVDSTGRPIGYDVLLVGPSQLAPQGDSVHATPWRFEISPPFALPHRGLYFFDIIDNTCLGEFNLVANTHDPYAPGGAWKTTAGFDCSSPAGVFTETPGIDLVFKIEFCDTTTATRSSTWGQLKKRYR
jgi:hypothetical protein